MATTKNADVKNNCVICLEPLLCANDDDDDKNDKMCDMGVSNCGHPAHFSCFQQWANFQNVTGDDKKERRLPCPTCQRDIKSFVKVYLRVENNNNETMYDTDDDEEEEFCDANENIAPSSSSTVVAPASPTSSGSADPPGRTPVGRNPSSASPTTISSVATGTVRSNNNNNNIATKKKKNQNNKAVHKKTQWYKKKWMAKQDEVKILKLEAQHRKKCHNKDMISLERYQLMTIQLENEVKRNNLTSRICRNAVGVAAFALGWLLNRKLMSCSGS